MTNPVLLIAMPLLFSFLAVIFKKWDKALLVLAVLLNVACLFIIQKGTYNIGGWIPPYGINLVLDGYSLLGVITVNLIYALSLFISFSYVEKYAVVLLISLAALNGMLLTGDLFNLFVFLEIGGIAAYIISSLTGSYKHTFNYLVTGSFGSGFFLMGVVILYGIFGSLNMADIHQKIAAGGFNTQVLLVPFLMIFTGLAVESKLIPFNGWVKGVFGSVNSLSGPILASAYVTAIVLVSGRLLAGVMVIPEQLKLVFTVVAVITFVLAEFAAFSGKSLRGMLLFSSIAQSGLVVALFIQGFTYPAVLQLTNNVAAKLVMFSIAGALATEAGSDNPDSLRGIFRKHKLIGFGFSAASMSLIGLPLFYGFFTKINILIGLFKSGNLWLPAVILGVSVIEGVYFIRLLVKLWNPGEEGVEADAGHTTELSLSGIMRSGMVAALIGVLLIVAGIFPELAGKGILTAAGAVKGDIPSYYSDLTGGMNK